MNKVTICYSAFGALVARDSLSQAALDPPSPVVRDSLARQCGTLSLVVGEQRYLVVAVGCLAAFVGSISATLSLMVSEHRIMDRNALAELLEVLDSRWEIEERSEERYTAPIEQVNGLAVLRVSQGFTCIEEMMRWMKDREARDREEEEYIRARYPRSCRSPLLCPLCNQQHQFAACPFRYYEEPDRPGPEWEEPERPAPEWEEPERPAPEWEEPERPAPEWEEPERPAPEWEERCPESQRGWRQ
ncbi:UNVERIFIED_CONTAM: hypothetical protein FKN15_067272 [Acipenser sinensis]